VGIYVGMSLSQPETAAPISLSPHPVLAVSLLSFLESPQKAGTGIVPISQTRTLKPRAGLWAGDTPRPVPENIQQHTDLLRGTHPFQSPNPSGAEEPGGPRSHSCCSDLQGIRRDGERERERKRERIQGGAGGTEKNRGTEGARSGRANKSTLQTGSAGVS
jgi:hypothetical protein